MTLFQFIQWCFRDETSGLITFLILWGAASTLVEIVKALRG